MVNPEGKNLIKKLIIISAILLMLCLLKGTGIHNELKEAAFWIC